jgi:hypothetical protein
LQVADTLFAFNEGDQHRVLIGQPLVFLHGMEPYRVGEVLE